MRVLSPRLILVGAGPGDPELISLKGMKALMKADVVLYDALVHPDILHFVREDARTQFVGKRAGKHSFTQKDINKLIVECALKYGTVVRLKGGDPFIFGRGHEEIEYAAQFDIETEVIPGISSATSLAGLHKIPLTKRDVNESFWVVTGTTQIEKRSKDFELAIQTNATIVILMGFGKLAKVVNAYKQLGKSQQAIAVIQNGSLPNEKIAVGTIENIEERVKTNGLGTPAVIVIGDVVKLYQEPVSANVERKIA